MGLGLSRRSADEVAGSGRAASVRSRGPRRSGEAGPLAGRAGRRPNHNGLILNQQVSNVRIKTGRCSGRRSAGQRKLSGNALTTKRICELVKRRLKDAGLPSRLSPHSFRVTAITSLLEQGVPMEDVQYLAGHAEPRTTTLYDRRKKKVTRNIVERIPI